MHKHKFYANFSRYDFKLDKKPLIFKCICGQEEEKSMRLFLWKLHWLLKDIVFEIKSTATKIVKKYK